MNNQYLKTLNKASIFKLVCIHGTISRLELHKRTGLSKMTVTNLVNEFIEAGFLRSGGTESSGLGRRTELIEIVPDAMHTLGVLITHHGLYISSVALDGSYIDPWKSPLDNSETADGLLDKMHAGIEDVMSRTAGASYAGVVISSIGCVNPDTNALELEAFFPGVGMVKDLQKRLGDRYGLPVFAENDANISAMAELYYGKRPAPDDFIYVQVDEGIGAGLVTNGSLVSGRSFAGEMGHMTVSQDGQPCRCGNRGCLELYASTTAACQWYADKTNQNDIPWQSLVNLARENDPTALEALSRMSHVLVSGLVNLINIIDTNCIYIGDKGTDLLEFFHDSMEESLNHRRFIQKHVSIRCASFPADARIRGVAPLMIERLVGNIS